MKRKTTTSKHDILRAIKAQRIKMDRLHTILQIQRQEFAEYLEYKKDMIGFEDFLKEKYEHKQSEDNGSGTDAGTGEE